MSEPTLQTARTLGERIRAAYLAKGMNRSQLQRALGVAYTTILKWERGVSVPTLENLDALSVVVGVPASVLRGEVDEVRETEYAAWADFVKTAPDMTRNERATLQSIRFEGQDPSPETYRALLLALRMTRR